MAKKLINIDLDDPNPAKAAFALETMFEYLATPACMRGRFARRVGQIVELERDLADANEGNRTKWAHAKTREEYDRQAVEFEKRRKDGEGPAIDVYNNVSGREPRRRVKDASRVCGYRIVGNHNVSDEFREALERRGASKLLSNGRRGRPKKSPPR